MAGGRIRHGGDLGEAAALAGAQGADWLDLSTGINPHAYPADFASKNLTALPQRGALTRLLDAARAAYRVPNDAAIVAAPGSQAILQWLPHLVPAARVIVLGPTYGEHAARWRKVAAVEERHAVPEPGEADVAVVVNPNNPDGRLTDPKALIALGASLRARGGLLVVDEAFMDLIPERSVAGAPGTLVIRSFGKFYGLAGLRLGFAVGAQPLVERLVDALGPWAVSAPALEVGTAALGDRGWAQAMRSQLACEREKLDAVLSRAGLRVAGGTDLFRYVTCSDAAGLQRALAELRIWTRRFDDPHHLRIGLPGPALDRLAAALTSITATA